MASLYYYLVLVNALVSLAAAGAVYWKNRHQPIGMPFGMTMLILGIWLAAFAQYFRPMDTERALWWAKFTLSMSILNHPFYFQAMCALAGKQRRFRWWIVASYVTGILLLVLLWHGNLIAGLRTSPYMAHYVHYNRVWYPVLGGFILFWIGFGYVILGLGARDQVGYRRTQIIYFIVAAFIVFLTTNLIILPVEYNINVPPVGFFVLPLNLALMAYVLAKARLADFNVVITRVLLYVVMLVVVIGMSSLVIAAMTVLKPDFMNQQQILFTMALVTAVGLALAGVLPRWLPRAERIMQERLFGTRYGYQDTLADLAKQLTRMPSIEQLLDEVASTIHTQMQVSRVAILMQNPLSGHYQLHSQSGLTAEEFIDSAEMAEDSPVVRWLRETGDVLVREEVARRADPQTMQALDAELGRLKTVVCVPMVVENNLTGVMCIGEKASRTMFFVSDLKLLTTLATEVALSVRYRRMEDEMFRKNKLIELGTIAAGVAHEIRNPLASIRTFAQLMPERMDDPEFRGEFAKLVIKDVDRITKVVETMLAFARPAQVTLADHAVADLVDEASLLVQARIKAKRIELTKQLHENPTVRVDKQQVLQVLVNLLSNAADALSEHGKIQVATGVRWIENGAGTDGEKRRQYAVVEVTDNGPGIPAAIRSRLFDPFFTTKKEGTGLGLSISQKIARDHGGIITVSSVEGKGTTFQVNLPLG